jgi:hypothetical protein
VASRDLIEFAALCEFLEPQPLSKVENPAFRAGLRGWLGDRVGRDAGMF